MDKIVDKVAALGVPGIVLVVAMGATGWAGAAAMTAALAALGGPFGMLGGVALLGILGLVSKGITQYGFEKLLFATIRKVRDGGKSIPQIKKEIKSYRFISKDMKAKAFYYLEELE